MYPNVDVKNNFSEQRSIFFPDMSQATDNFKVLRDVKGGNDGDNINDVLLYYGDVIKQHVIFFSGDIQVNHFPVSTRCRFNVR